MTGRKTNYNVTARSLDSYKFKRKALYIFLND